MKKILSMLLVFLTTVFLVSCQGDVHTIYFDVNGGSPQVTKQEVKNKGFASHPEETVTKEGYSFAYWFDSETEDQFLFEITEVTKDYILVAYWNELPGNGDNVEEEFTVTFIHNDDNNQTTTEKVQKNKFATKPSNPTKEGYIFLGWYTDLSNSVAYDFDSPITANLTLYGKWEVNNDESGKHIVKYVTNGGTAVADQKIKDGTKIPSLPKPIRSGFKHVGWYTDIQLNNLFDNNTLITEDITLYAKWEEREVGDLLDYYKGHNIENLEGIELREALKKRLNDGAIFRSYGSSLNDPLRDADEHWINKNNVYTIYDGAEMGKNDNGGGGSKVQWDKEHVTPKSWYNQKYSKREGDLHNLRVSRSSINGSRGNLKFADGSGDYGKIGGGFYAGDDHRGDSARIVMYMIVMLPDVLNPGVAFMGNDPVSTMLKWHELDPVDDFEIRRNEVLFGYQKNRNPFIDHPEFAELIWGSLNTSLTNQTKLDNLIVSTNLVVDIIINQEIYVPNPRFYF